jgi:hypothetical protein
MELVQGRIYWWTLVLAALKLHVLLLVNLFNLLLRSFH